MNGKKSLKNTPKPHSLLIIKEIFMERTFVFIKPDGVKANIVGRVLSRFEKAGLRLAAITSARPSRGQVEDHYAEHKGRDFHEPLVEFTLSGNIVLMILEGEDAVNVVRKMIGATNPKDAGKGTIRVDFGTGIPNNIIHASDSVESANRESEMWLRFFM